MSYRNTHTTESAAAKAGFSTATGDRINQDGRLPSQKAQPRGRRRPDPLADIFESVVVPRLKASEDMRPVAVDRELCVGQFGDVACIDPITGQCRPDA